MLGRKPRAHAKVVEQLQSPYVCLTGAGYPLEIHTVTTADGVVLQMERIPRPGSSRVAFFLHGILDTSLTWVSSGVTGSQVRQRRHVMLSLQALAFSAPFKQRRQSRMQSTRQPRNAQVLENSCADVRTCCLLQAFAAWDQGFDVWLGSSRSNAPRIARGKTGPTCRIGGSNRCNSLYLYCVCYEPCFEGWLNPPAQKGPGINVRACAGRILVCGNHFHLLLLLLVLLLLLLLRTCRPSQAGPGLLLFQSE